MGLYSIIRPLLIGWSSQLLSWITLFLAEVEQFWSQIRTTREKLHWRAGYPRIWLKIALWWDVCSCGLSVSWQLHYSTADWPQLPHLKLKNFFSIRYWEFLAKDDLPEPLIKTSYLTIHWVVLLHVGLMTCHFKDLPLHQMFVQFFN